MIQEFAVLLVQYAASSRSEPLIDSQTSLYTIALSAVTVAGFFLQHYFFRKMTDRHLESIRQTGSERLQLLREEIRVNSKRYDYRADGLDALLERARRAKDCAVNLASLDRSRDGDRKIISVTVLSLQAIVAFLEPVSAVIKFNYLSEEDKGLYSTLCDGLAAVVLTTDPDTKADQKQRGKLSIALASMMDGFESFEQHVLRVLQKLEDSDVKPIHDHVNVG